MRLSSANGITALIVAAALAACTTTTSPPPPAPEPPAVSSGNYIGSGKASYYGNKHQNKLTANGERFDQGSLTAAHRTLPFGTRVLVTNTRNGKSVVVRINDRGPFVRGRVIDLSKAAFERIASTRLGVVSVRLEKFE